MKEAVVVFSWIAAIAASVPLLMFSIEVLLGLWRGRPHKIISGAYSTCVLIPAHNEERIIRATLDRLHAVLPANASILVVADNCSDRTAEIVRQQGVPVIERFDADRRGKGFALDHGRDWLSKEPPECVIVFDADCTTDAKSLEDLIHFSTAKSAIVQSAYVFEPDHSVAPKVQISNFALWVKNVVRQRGANRLGGSAILTGTGMAFPWAVFAELPLATASIVEDLALTIDLVRAGRSPCYLDQAKMSSIAAIETATLEQRSRWEHGFLDGARRHGLPVVLGGMKRLDRKSMLLGLHLLVPPLSLLLMTALLTAVILAGVAGMTGYWLSLIAVLGFLSLALFSVILAWLSGGYKWLKATAMVLLPMYLLWKIPVYLRYALGQTATWVRTDRNIHS
jgi:cellulose synthase/poly-beta-1,6-N-acetylglucosamine synthase-like glycosyltransferase